LNKGKKVEKTHLCEWTSEALEKSLTAKNIKSGFKKTGIWPLNHQAVTTQMNPSQGFEEGQEGYDIAAATQSNDSDSSGACEDADQAEFDLGATSPENSVLERQRERSDMHVPCEGISTDAPTRHYYVDVQNGEESNYHLSDQHTRIDSAFRAQIHEGNEQNISNFLALPEVIPAKKRTRQQPLLDYTSSRILTSRDYIAGLEELLARKEATAAAAKKKKEDKEATKEQRKAAKEQQQKLKEERAQERARKKQEKENEILARRAGGATRGRQERVEPPQPAQAIPAESGQVQQWSQAPQAPHAPRPAPLSYPWVYPPYANPHAHAFYPPAYRFYTEENARAGPA